MLDSVADQVLERVSPEGDIDALARVVASVLVDDEYLDLACLDAVEAGVREAVDEADEDTLDAVVEEVQSRVADRVTADAKRLAVALFKEAAIRAARAG